MLALAVSATLLACSLPGASQLLDRPAPRYIIVGEMHGNTQTPEAFAELVCAIATKTTPVQVAVEAPAHSQPEIDTFLNSDGDAAAHATFLKSIIWSSPFKDGRSSMAYMALFEQLRRLKKAGIIAGVSACQPDQGAPQQTETAYNRAMAELWMQALSHVSHGTLIALAGNVHARKATLKLGGATIIPAAEDLPRSDTITIDVPADGQSWNCMGSCGPHHSSGVVGLRREIIFGLDQVDAYDGELTLGLHTTASPPAVAALPEGR